MMKHLYQMLFRSSFLPGLLTFGLSAMSVQAVPLLLNFQGRVTVENTVFTGDGQFKFALVNAGGSQSFWSNDGTSSEGSEPHSAVTVPVVNGHYSLHLGDSSLVNSGVLQASVFDNDPLFLRIWFSDGTHDFERLGTADHRISSVAYALRAETVASLPGNFVTEANLTTALQDKLAALQAQIDTLETAIAANTAKVGYTDNLVAANSAVAANTAKAGVTTDLVDAIAANTAKVGYTDDLVAANSAVAANTAKVGITTDQADAIAANTANAGSVAAGSVVASDSASDSTLVDDGYSKFLSTVADSWSASPGSGAPSARSAHGSVWVGSGMAIWGGDNGAGALGTGATYEPSTDTWASISSLDAPEARSHHSTVWSGTELIVWGGYGQGGGLLNTGARYEVATQSWLTLSDADAPDVRYGNAAVWTGSRMLVWGGGDMGGILDDLVVYDPALDQWTTLSVGGAPADRHSSTAVLAGDRVLIWGGVGAGGELGDGAVLVLANGVPSAWSAMATTGAPGARSDHAAVWTGSKLIVWGGMNGFTHLGDGGIYDPTSDSWTAMASDNAPAARENHAAVWTGTEMVVVGGDGVSGALSDSHAYNPTSDTWRTLDGSVGSREDLSAVWTGTQVLVFGGESGSQKVDLPMEIDPTLPVHLYRKE